MTPLYGLDAYKLANPYDDMPRTRGGHYDDPDYDVEPEPEPAEPLLSIGGAECTVTDALNAHDWRSDGPEIEALYRLRVGESVTIGAVVVGRVA